MSSDPVAEIREALEMLGQYGWRGAANAALRALAELESRAAETEAARDCAMTKALERGDRLREAEAVLASEAESAHEWRELCGEKVQRIVEVEAERDMHRADSLRYFGRAEAAEAAVARQAEALRLAATLLERASFDAHDSEWAREQTAVVRAVLASPEAPTTTKEESCTHLDVSASTAASIAGSAGSASPEAAATEPPTDWQKYAEDYVSGDPERLRSHLPEWLHGEPAALPAVDAAPPPSERDQGDDRSAVASVNSIPGDFWREVPCGHPQDPVAARALDGHWVCHCATILDPANALSDGRKEGAPGPLVPCDTCGCYVALPQATLSPPFSAGSPVVAASEETEQ